MKFIKHINVLSLFLIYAMALTCAQAEFPGYTHIPCTFTPIMRPLIRADSASGKFHFTHPHVPVKQGTSQNWSGYVAVTNLKKPAVNSVTGVAGSWVVPTVTKSTKKTYCSLWVGIDGYTSPSVEQIGTEHDWNGKTQSNYAWFEMYPLNSYEIVGFPVKPGDSMSGTVAYQGNGIFKLSLANNTRKVYTTIPTSYTKSSTAQRSSAEWVLEAPYYKGILPLSHFGTAKFSNCFAIINGVTAAISNKKWVHEAMTMVTSSRVQKAVPSALNSTGLNFNVTWKHE